MNDSILENDVGVVGLLSKTSTVIDKDVDKSNDNLHYCYKISKFETDVEEVVFCSCCFCCKNLTAKHTISSCFNLDKYTVTDIKDKILQKAFFSIQLSRILIVLNILCFFVSYAVLLQSYHLIFGFLPTISANTSIPYILVYSILLSIISFFFVKSFTLLINKQFKGFTTFLFAGLIFLIILAGVIAFPLLTTSKSKGFSGSIKPFTTDSVVIDGNS